MWKRVYQWHKKLFIAKDYCCFAVHIFVLLKQLRYQLDLCDRSGHLYYLYVALVQIPYCVGKFEPFRQWEFLQVAAQEQTSFLILSGSVVFVGIPEKKALTVLFFRNIPNMSKQTLFTFIQGTESHKGIILRIKRCGHHSVLNEIAINKTLITNSSLPNIRGKLSIYVRHFFPQLKAFQLVVKHRIPRHVFPERLKYFNHTVLHIGKLDVDFLFLGNIAEKFLRIYKVLVYIVEIA